MNPEELKQELISVKNNNYIAGNTDVETILPGMLRYIGSADDILRDELIYSTFHKWTINGTLSSEQMRNVLSVCLDGGHLFYGIGEKDTDSVFTRTFSILLVPLAFCLDSKQPFLSQRDVNDIKEKVITYVKLEKDVRGYVEGKGWAHSTAHSADALDDIARSEYIGHDALWEILAAIKDKMCIDHYTYINNEDDRMAAAAISVIGRGLLKCEETAEWINGFCSVKKTGAYPAGLRAAVNARNFLRSLYFLAYDNKDMRCVSDAALAALRNM